MKSIIIHSFMINDLKLKGVELLYFALIYSFSQFAQNYFADDKTTCAFLNISRAQLFRVRSSLINKGLINSSDKGLSCPLCTDYLEENLSELIRIAKTPWLD